MHRQLVVNYVNWPNAFGLVLINVCAGFGVASIFFCAKQLRHLLFRNCFNLFARRNYLHFVLPKFLLALLHFCCFFLAMSFDFLCLLQKHKYKSNCICSMSLICIGICL